MENDPEIISGEGAEGAEGGEDVEGGGGEGAEDQEQSPTSEVVSLSIMLGDFIKVIAPTHQEIHEHTFLVDYLSSRKIRLVDIDTREPTILKLDATGNLTDESITSIELLDRAEEKGYARQNNLVVSTWVDIRFGGDIPTIITGMITNLEEDMIEIRTYPEDEMIYINFGYMGIPENLPIEEIKIRAPPSSFGATTAAAGEAAAGEAAEGGEAGFLAMGMDAVVPPSSSSDAADLSPLEQRRRERQLARQKEQAGEDATEQPEGESEYTVLSASGFGAAAAAAASAAAPLAPLPTSTIREKLRSILLDADQIQVGEELEVLVQTVDIPDENRRFNLEKQCDDLLDTLMSNVPAPEKSRSVLANIQRMVLRFRELRRNFSRFDTNGNPAVPPPKSAAYRPLVESLMKMDQALRWIIPIVKTRKVIYDIPIDERTAAEMDIVPRLIQEEREAENELQRQWYDGSLTYAQYMTNLSARHFTPSTDPRYTHDVISTRQVNENITAVIDNLDDFYSSVITGEEVKRRRFVIQKYNLGLAKVRPATAATAATATAADENSAILKRTTEFANLTQNDRMNITGFMTFPEPVMRYSRITMPTINILDKCDLNAKHVHYWDMLRQMMTLTTHDITDLNTPLDLNAQGLLREIKQFVLEPAAVAVAGAAAAAAPVSERDKYRKFLEVIIPKTRTIFEMMRQYIHGRLTLQDVLSFIEPFLIYQDDLNVKQYDEIVAFLYERVLEYKRNYATNFRKFGRLRSFHYNVRYMGVSMIYKLIVTGKMMDADVFKAYGFQDTQVRSAVAGAAAGAAAGGMDERQRQQMRGRSYAAGLSEQTDYNENLLSSSELLSRMLAVDYAKLYMDAVAITTTELITPFDFNLVLGEQSQQLRDAGAMRGVAMRGGAPGGGAAAAAATAATVATDAPKRFGMVLAKNYSNEEALQEDNDRDQPIFFDKKYDTTDYAFLESYRDQQESMSSTDFSMFLVDELIKNKKMTYEDAKKESEAILLGPGLRPVNDGDYAVVEIDEYVEPTTADEDDLGTTETKFLYYKRDNGKWVRDTSIPEIIPSSDRNYFCNVERDCIPFAVDATRNMMSELETMEGAAGASGGAASSHHPHDAMAHITSQDGTAAIKKVFLDKMKAEFDVKYQVTRENFMEFVNKKFEYDLKNISRITEIQNKEFYKYNDRKYKIGFQAQPKSSGAGAGAGDADDDDDIDAIISPMEPLKDKIVAQTDFVKRQYDLMQFITSFTRKANEIMDEDTNWLYCIKSNAKLLPSFYETIAVAFIQGGGGGRASALSVVIDTICKERGTISDDGEAWVDKYSGALIKKIEHVTEEGFDDAGFRLVTRDIIEADLGEGVLKVAKPVAASASAAGGAAGGGGLHGISILEKYDSPNARIINNIVTTMTGYMGIDLHAEREFIIQHTLTLLETAVPTEEKYRERSEKMFREKGKHLPPYKETFFQTLLLLTLCHLTVAIQCAIPTPKTRKTHAGCIRSFTGYPIDGDGDISGMMYIACIAYKIRTSIEPWNTLKSFKKEGDILAKMKLLLDASIITKQVIKERMQTKRDYLKSREGGAGGADAIPEELSIMRWGNYMPPMKSLDNMPTPQNVASEFADQLITDMKRGYHGQHEKLAVLESKSMYFSLSIQQMIHSVVKNSSPLLLNMASEPFLENACCNEPTDRRSKRVIDYFMEREQNIHHHNRIIGFLTKTARDMAVMTRATTIIDNRNTRYQYPNIPADFDEKTIYRAFIHYCRMNQQYTAAASDAAGSANPVATAVAMYLHPEIREICPPRPQDWNPTDIIETKIAKLKKDSNIFDEKSLERLLKAVNRHKMVDADYKTAVRPQENTQFQRFQDAVLHLERCHEDDSRGGSSAAPEEQRSELDQCIIPRELRQLILAILQSGSPTMVQEDTQEMRDLKNYLQTKNRELRASVLGFIQQHAKQTKGKFRDIERIVDTVLTFEINKSSTVLMSATDETAAKSIQFMRNTLTRFIDVIPNIIHNGVDFDDTNIPKHWGFSDTHMKDVKGIIASHYTSLKSFYNDHVIKEVLRHAEHHYRDLKLMVDNTPFMAEIFFDEEKDAKIAATAAALAVVQNQGLAASAAAAAAAAREEPREVDVVKELGERVPHSTRKNIFTMYSVFDRSIVCNLNLFYFLSFMRTFVQLVAETPITMYQSEPTRVKRKDAKATTATTATKKGAKGVKTTAYALSSTPGAIARNANFREEEEAEEDEIDPHSRLYSRDAATAEKGQLLSDMDIVMGDKKALSQRVSELMVAYVRMIEKDKSAINFNLANIKEKLTRVKDKEKDGVVERIGAMSAGERQLENMMKTHKMGIWSRGTSQTGVVIYDQDYYDEERDEMEKIAQKERQLGRRDYVTDMNREIYVMDALEADRSAAEIEAHELDMSTGIPEDDDAGEDDTAYIHQHDDEGEGE